MAWCSSPQMLAKATYYTGFICRGKLNSWPVWHIFMQYYSLIPYSILPFLLLFFPVFNVVRFLTSGYLDKKFIVLCRAYLHSKTAWAKVLSVVGDYSNFFLFLFIPNHWSCWVLFNAS